MKLSNLFRCRKRLTRGWVAVKKDGKITWEYDPETARNMLKTRMLVEEISKELRRNT